MRWSAVPFSSRLAAAGPWCLHISGLRLRLRLRLRAAGCGLRLRLQRLRLLLIELWHDDLVVPSAVGFRAAVLALRAELLGCQVASTLPG